VLRIVVQFLLQHVGVIYLRTTRPEMPRPFRIWLYPLPPVLAILGFCYVLFSRKNFERELLLAAVVVAGAVVSWAFTSMAHRFGPKPRETEHP
jgi:APA family basic amino acid/polyamine antiporter